MISSLKKLILKIKDEYKINKKNILAHSDIAPFRKKDPGKNFPWKLLINEKIILNFQNVTKNDTKITNHLRVVSRAPCLNECFSISFFLSILKGIKTYFINILQYLM